MSDIILTTTVWKRRSGFAQFSDAITGANSWEQRRITLHRPANKTKTATRLCYYAIDGKTPRGTVYIKSERATIWANHHPSDGTQPTPYSLSILPDGGTKWKFCFNDRNTQFAWLLALSDIVVEDCVKEYNSKILVKEASNWVNHGGFHRLYEEGTSGLFENIKDMLLDENYTRQKSEESIDVEIKRDCDRGDDVFSKEKEESNSDEMTKSSPVKVAAISSKKEVGLSQQKLCQAFVVVNLSVMYAYWTAQSESFVAVPWWQLLMAMNATVYYIINFCPKSESPENDLTPPPPQIRNEEAVTFEKEPSTSIESRSFEDLDEKDPSSFATKSTIGKALLKSEEVPLSAVPMEIHSPKRVLSDAAHQRTNHLSEEEMTAHLHERWAMSAPDCDLSGSWTLIADDSFKTEYDTYLKQLVFSRITRGVACSLIARTTEITKQSRGGRELYLKGINPKGAWERVLVSSGYPDFETDGKQKDFTHLKTSIKTADAEVVEAEAWWEARGTLHRSWLRGGTKYGGGDFESLRYIEEGSGGNVLVSNMVYHIIQNVNIFVPLNIFLSGKGV